MEDSSRAMDCARLSESTGILSDFWLLSRSTARQKHGDCERICEGIRGIMYTAT